MHKAVHILSVPALAIAAMVSSQQAWSGYDANMSGVVTDVVTYTLNADVLFRLSNQPSSHPSCNAYYFVIPSTAPADNRKAMLARLLVAMTSGASVNIGYDSTGDCVNGYIRVHRVG